MNHSQEEIYQTHEKLKETASPVGAVVGALIGVAPAVAIYAFFVEMGAILYFFILIPAAIIGLAAQLTGRVYRVQHRIPVAIIASVTYLACVYYFNYKPLFYFLVPLIFFTALTVSKRLLNRLESIVVDMEAEGRLDP